MAGKKQQKKTAKRTARKTGLKQGGKGLYKAVKAIAKNEAEKMLETKYLANVNRLGDSTYNMPITNRLTTGFNLSPTSLQDLQPCFPQIKRGAGTDGIIGNRIHMMSGKTDFLISLAPTANIGLEIIVKLFCLESRKVRDYNEMNSFSVANTLLRIGDDETIDWTPSAATYVPLLDHLPVNKSSWKVHHVKTFRLTKNSGFINGETVTPAVNSANQAYHRYTWNWGSNKVLKYEENPLKANSAVYPTNFAPLWGIVAYYPNGTSVGSDGTAMNVNVASTNHLYYKDG